MRPREEAGPLTGLRVVVTRPAHQARGLCRMIEEAGGQAVQVPVIEIAPPADPVGAAHAIERLGEYDVIVFVSPNAVQAVFDLLRGRPWPARTRIAAVGRGSAEAIAARGWRVDIRPAREFNSEGLLTEEAFRDPDGLRVIIARGEDGRELLADTLRARGAVVDFAPVYRRVMPAGAPEALARAAAAPVDAIVATSNEGLRNLWEAAGERLRPWLLARQLVVIARRGAELARTLGFTHPARVAPEASDAGLLQALREWALDTRSDAATEGDARA